MTIMMINVLSSWSCYQLYILVYDIHHILLKHSMWKKWQYTLYNVFECHICLQAMFRIWAADSHTVSLINDAKRLFSLSGQVSENFFYCFFFFFFFLLSTYSPNYIRCSLMEILHTALLFVMHVLLLQLSEKLFCIQLDF